MMFTEGIFENDNENLYVDLCYFPLIGRDLMSDNPKIYTSAKVMVRETPIREHTQQYQINQGRVVHEHTQHQIIMYNHANNITLPTTNNAQEVRNENQVNSTEEKSRCSVY